MSPLPNNGLSFHAYFRCVPDKELPAILARAAHQAQVRLLGHVQEKYPRWQLGEQDTPYDVVVDVREPWSQLATIVDDRHLERYGATGLASLFAGLADEIQAQLARTTSTGGVGYIEERELTGELEFVDWLQYWSVDVVSRWGLETLKTGPFHQVEERANGGCLLLLAAEPDDESMSRKAAAEFLGITLRPIYAKVTADKRVKLAWR